MLVEGLKQKWQELNEVDSYGMSELDSFIGLGILGVFGSIAFVVDGKFRGEVTRDVANFVDGKVQDFLARRFDSRMSRAAGVEDTKDILDKPSQ